MRVSGFFAICIISLLSGCMTGPGKQNAEAPSVGGRKELASQFIDQGAYPKAISLLLPLSREVPKDESVLLLLAGAYLGNGSYEAAEQVYRRILTMNPSNHDAKLSYGYLLILKKQPASARKVFDEMIKEGSYPYMERVYVNYGLSHMEEKRCEPAMAKFNDALTLDPTFITAYFNIGKCHMMMRQYKLAAQSLKKAVDFCPGCVDPSLELARAYYLSGQPKSAVERLESLLSENLDKQSESRAKRLLHQMRR